MGGINSMEVPDKKRGEEGFSEDDEGHSGGPQLVASLLNSVGEQDLVNNLEKREVFPELASTVKTQRMDAAHNKHTVLGKRLKPLHYVGHRRIGSSILDRILKGG